MVIGGGVFQILMIQAKKEQFLVETVLMANYNPPLAICWIEREKEEMPSSSVCVVYEISLSPSKHNEFK